MKTPSPKVKLTKVAAAFKPEVETAAWTEYRPGQQDNVKSLPVDYTIIGYLLKPLVEGTQIVIFRIERNDVNTPGEFVSSEIVHVDGNTIYTRNSVYLIDFLTDKPE
jgi:hypothetical protein